MELNHPCNDSGCGEMPELKRLNYFYGQMLGVNDFRTEQSYFREKLKLTNRCLHGYGTVCGLMVVQEGAPQDCHGEGDAERREIVAQLDDLAVQLKEAREKEDAQAVKAIEDKIGRLRQRLQELPPGDCTPAPGVQVTLEPGLALDCEGNQIVVPRKHRFDPWTLLSDTDRRRVLDGQGIDLYLSLCYCEQGVDPVRPVMPNACGATSECTYGKVRDAYRLTLSATAPERDTRCESCCSCCENACLPIAVLRGYRKGQPASAIDNSIRRPLATYPATTITGISWTHGATYDAEEAGAILGSPDEAPGLQVNFSRPVLTSTLANGVIDVWVLEGGNTKHAGMYYLDGAFEDFGGAEAVDSVRYTYQGTERLDDGDRVLITIRCAFILDECCVPVDGTHVGGRVPLIDSFKDFDRSTAAPRCALKPPGYGPWTSGANSPGSNFESWFYIDSEKDAEKRRGNKEIVK
jgi:hypothetical protein